MKGKGKRLYGFQRKAFYVPCTEEEHEAMVAVAAAEGENLTTVLRKRIFMDERDPARVEVPQRVSLGMTRLVSMALGDDARLSLDVKVPMTAERLGELSGQFQAARECLGVVAVEKGEV